MKIIIYILFVYLPLITIGQNGPLNKFYNKEGKLLVDTSYILRNYDSKKNILKKERSTIKKLLKELDYPNFAREAGIPARILIVISFDNGMATDIDFIPQ